MWYCKGDYHDVIRKFFIIRVVSLTGKTTASTFRGAIEELWFNLYSRSSSSSTLDSSGFEHVMVGEYSVSTFRHFAKVLIKVLTLQAVF